VKTIQRNHNLSEGFTSEILAKEDFSSPNTVLPGMKKALHPGSEIFASLNHWDEPNRFMLKNIIIESARTMTDADGFVTDQIFSDHYHHLDLQFVIELSKVIGRRHFIAGPSFSKVPAFLQSRLLDELVDHDASGIMYDVRDTDMDDFDTLQPLAKLKIHAKKRIVIIPLVRDESQLRELTGSIPFDTVALDRQT